MTAGALDPRLGRAGVERRVRRAGWLPLGILAAVLIYFVYAWHAFGMTEILGRAQPEKGILLVSDAVAYKIHVTRSNRTNELEVATEGERTATFETLPDWVKGTADAFEVDLGEGHVVAVDGRQVSYDIPGYGRIVAVIGEDGISTTLPKGAGTPDWLTVVDVKLDARPTFERRLQVTRSKIEIHRYYYGWEHFWFPFRSPLHGLGFGEIVTLAFSDERLDPQRSNAALIFRTFWDNPDWQHGIIAVAILETVLMALLGTLTAGLLGLPLAFLAARNFSPHGTLRVLIRRLFDFVRGIDMLIWSLIFIRAFGLGPLTGAMAIAFTDTGTLGKLFSEALENIDKKQVEGVQSTGARRLQQYRFGVIPQILPVLISQVLYYLESNTRSATVIGALGAGGIGLVLVETMRTQRDWENVAYIIVLIIGLVVVIDTVSNWLRRKLIAGRG